MFHVPNAVFPPQVGSKVFVYLLTDSQPSLDFALAKGMQSYLGLPEDDKLSPHKFFVCGQGWAQGRCFGEQQSVQCLEMKDVGLGARLCVAVGFWCCSCD